MTDRSKLMSVEESAHVLAEYQTGLVQSDPELVAKNRALARETLLARAEWYRAGMPDIDDREQYFQSGDLLRDVALDIEIALGIGDQ